MAGIIQKTVGGIKRMFGVRELADNYRFVKNFSKEVITSELHAKPEGRKPITEDSVQLQATYAVFKKLCIAYAILSVLAVLYAGYNFGHHYIIPGLLSISFAALCLSFAFRYHFWMFQIRKGALGYSFKEWLNSTFGKGV